MPRPLSRLPHPRFLLFLLVFLGTGALAGLWLRPASALILGFDLAAGLFIAGSLRLWLRRDAARARDEALRDDGGRLFLLLVSVAVMAVILAAVARMVRDLHQMGAAQFGAVVATLVLAWLFAHLVFAHHYAHMFHDRRSARGLAFPQAPGAAGALAAEPDFSDFVYFAFTIGMTSQTSDVVITAPRIRRIATLQGLFAFFFNLGVLALCVNVLSGVL